MQLTTTSQRGFAPATLTEAITFSEMLSNSNMVPKAYQNKPQDILVCVQWGMEMGLAPMQALQNIAVINGKPSVYGDAMMALVQASAVCDDVEEYFENEGTPNPVAVCVAKRKNRKPVVAKFSVEDAKRAGLWGKQGPWSAYPKRMMQMRARGFALRDAFPDVLKGLISAEEAQDYPDEAKPRPAKDITPRNPLDMVAKPAPVAIPAMTSDPQVIAEAMADTVDEEPAVVQPEVVEVVEPVAEWVQPVVQPDGVQPIGYALMVPGKEDAYSVHNSLDEWADAYEDLADKTARAGKRPARDRMTILKELRLINEEVIQRIDSIKRIRHTASYSQRIKALGAAIAD
jgi:hypothetical protein